jgi:hypothetical protein
VVIRQGFLRQSLSAGKELLGVLRLCLVKCAVTGHSSEANPMSKTIEIIDRGRGLQLSTSRVTVQDLVPYFQEEFSSAEIIRWIPTLTAEEIAVVERYYREHQQELDEEDRQMRERSATRKNPEWVEKVLLEARAERLAITERLRQQQGNGEAK